MKDTVLFIVELLRIILILFAALVGYSLLNTFLMDFFGGLDVFEGNDFFRTWFFLLQTLGILGLVTVLYRNKLEKSGWMAKYQGPLQARTVWWIVRISLAAIVASYGIFFGLVVFSG